MYLLLKNKFCFVTTKISDRKVRVAKQAPSANCDFKSENQEKIRTPWRGIEPRSPV